MRKIINDYTANTDTQLASNLDLTKPIGVEGISGVRGFVAVENRGEGDKQQVSARRFTKGIPGTYVWLSAVPSLRNLMSREAHVSLTWYVFDSQKELLQWLAEGR